MKKIKINNYKENLDKIFEITTDYRKAKGIPVEYKDNCFYVSQEDLDRIDESLFYYSLSYKDLVMGGDYVETIEIKTKYLGIE